MKTRITQTLISSWQYAMDCREECQEDAYNDFLAKLVREPEEPTQEMLNGIEFENLVYSIADGSYQPIAKSVIRPSDNPNGDTDTKTIIEDHKWYQGASAVAKYIGCAPVQVRAWRECRMGDYDLQVYGIMDALKAGTIYDVKFSNRGFGSADLAGKYLNSPQHPTYFYLCPEADTFMYLVSDGADIYTETYTRKNTRPFEEIVTDFLTSLETLGLTDVYREKWGTE